MAEPLKNSFGVDIPGKIADMIAAVHPPFQKSNFVAEALSGYEELELMPRGRKIAQALKTHLPQNYDEAIDVLVRSLGPKLDKTDNAGMAPFIYMPHSFFVAEHGLFHFESSMTAIYEITQRFTSEFSIRPFLIHHTQQTLDRLRIWAQDPSAHVRRLVSEGTRPRLPWAIRIPQFQKDPSPVIELLELLKDDKELYVRRSVANNLNDIGKDNPPALFKVAQKWATENLAGEHLHNRKWVIRHALRSAVKKGQAEALKIMGFKGAVPFNLQHKQVLVAADKKKVVIQFELNNPSRHAEHYLVDFQIHYVKANGRTSPKVFKLKSVTLGGKQRALFSKSVSLKDMTTRRHYPGRHSVEALINGRPVPLGMFHISHTKG